MADPPSRLYATPVYVALQPGEYITNDYYSGRTDKQRREDLREEKLEEMRQLVLRVYKIVKWLFS